MNHRTYDGQRFSPLARINRDNVKGLKLVYAVPLSGSHGSEFLEATPLAEDGFLYITDAWGVLYKIDATSGRYGPRRLADGSQAGARGGEPRRGAVGQLRDLAGEHPGAHHRDRQEYRQGGVGNQRLGRRAHHRHRRTAPDQGQDRVRRLRRRQRRARLDGGARRRDRQAAVAQVHHSGAGRARARKPGRTRTTPGRPAAAPCGSPAPTIPTPTRPCGASAIRCR